MWIFVKGQPIANLWSWLKRMSKEKINFYYFGFKIVAILRWKAYQVLECLQLRSTHQESNSFPPKRCSVLDPYFCWHVQSYPRWVCIPSVCHSHFSIFRRKPFFTMQFVPKSILEVQGKTFLKYSKLYSQIVNFLDDSISHIIFAHCIRKLHYAMRS